MLFLLTISSDDLKPGKYPCQKSNLSFWTNFEVWNSSHVTFQFVSSFCCWVFSFSAWSYQSGCPPSIFISPHTHTTVTGVSFLSLARLSQEQLGFSEFETVMKSQIKLYVQRQLSNTLIAGAESRFEVCHFIFQQQVLRRKRQRGGKRQREFFMDSASFPQKFSWTRLHNYRTECGVHSTCMIILGKCAGVCWLI